MISWANIQLIMNYNVFFVYPRVMFVEISLPRMAANAMCKSVAYIWCEHVLGWRMVTDMTRREICCCEFKVAQAEAAIVPGPNRLDKFITNARRVRFV